MIWFQRLHLSDWPGRRLRSCIGARERSWNERLSATARGRPQWLREPPPEVREAVETLRAEARKLRSHGKVGR